MKKIISIIVVFFSIYTLANADEWKTQNKWKISCGLTDKEALVINGKPKKITIKILLRLIVQYLN